MEERLGHPRDDRAGFGGQVRELPGIAFELLETRLDNVLRRLGVGRTIWACRQIVAHGHVIVNGRKTDRPRSDGEEGLRVVRVLEAAEKSISNSGHVEVIEEVRSWI